MSSISEKSLDAKVTCVHSPPLFSKEQDDEGKTQNNESCHLHTGNELEPSPEGCDNVQNYSYASSAKSTSTPSVSPYPHVNPSNSINKSLQTCCQEIKCGKEEEYNTAGNETCDENDLVELNRLKRENRFLRLQLLRIQEERQRHCTNSNKSEQEEEYKNISTNKKELNEFQPCSVAEPSAVSTHNNKPTQCDVEYTNIDNGEGDGKVVKEKRWENNQLIEVPALSSDSPNVIHTHEHGRLDNDSDSVNSSSRSSNSCCSSNTSLLHSLESNEMELFCEEKKTNQIKSEPHLEEGYDNDTSSSYNNSKYDMATASTTTVQQINAHDNESYTNQNVCEEPLQLHENVTSHHLNKELCSSTEITHRANSEPKFAHQYTGTDDDDASNNNKQINECIANITGNNDSNDSMDVCEENEALKLRLQMLQRKSNREKLKRAATERQLRYEIELLRLALDREARNANHTQEKEEKEREQIKLELEDEKGQHNNSWKMNSTPQTKSVEVMQHQRKLELEAATHETDSTQKDNSETSATDTSFLLDRNNSRRRRKSKLHDTVEDNITITTRTVKDETSQHNERKQMLGNIERNLFTYPLDTTQLSLESSELPVAYALHMNSSNRRAERKARLLQVQRQMSQYNNYEQEELLSSSPQPLSTPREASTPITTSVVAAATTTNTCQCSDDNNNDNEQTKSNNRAVYSSVAFRRQRKQQQQEPRYWSQTNYNHNTRTTTSKNNNTSMTVNPNQIGIEVTDKIKDRSWYLCKVIAYALRHSIQVCKQDYVCSHTFSSTSTSTSPILLDEHTEHNNDVETIISTSQEAKGAGSHNVPETNNADPMPCVMNKISTIALQRAINETVSYEFRCIHNLPHILLTPRNRTTYYDQTNYKGNPISNSSSSTNSSWNNNNNNNNCMCKVGFNEFCDKCQFQTCDLALEGRIDTLPSPIHSLMSSATSYPNSISIGSNTIISNSNSSSSNSNKKALHATHECTSKEWNNVAFEDENDDPNLISTFASSSFSAFGTNYYNNSNDEDINYSAQQNNWRSNNAEQRTSNSNNTFASSTTLPSSFSPVSVNESGYQLHPRTTSTFSYSCNSSSANRSPRSPFHKSHHRGNYFSNRGELREDVVSVTFHAPVIFAQIRDYLQCNCNELRSAAAFSVWRQSLSPGKSGATLYYFGNYMVKSLRESEFTFFVRKLLPAYAMYCERNPHTFLCHFYALWTVEWVKTNDKQRYVLMHNIFNTQYYIHRIYDVKGSSIGRSGYTNSPQSSSLSSPSPSSLHSSIGKTKDMKDKKSTKYNYNSPPSRTAFGALLLKDNDLPSTLIICGAYHRAFLIAQFRSDVHFLLGLDIVDYSCVIGVRSRIFAGNDVHKSEHASMTSLPSSQETPDKEKCSGSNAHETNNLQTCLVHSHAEKTTTWDKDMVNTLCSTKSKTNNLDVEQTFFAKVDDHNSRDNSECGYVYLHNCDGGLLSLPIYTTPDHSAAREDVYYIGLIDLLQEYNSAKKIESFAKGLINDRNAISVIPPKEYGERLIKVFERITVERNKKA